MSVAKHLPDTAILAEESDGYVPEDCSEGEGEYVDVFRVTQHLLAYGALIEHACGIGGVMDIDDTAEQQRAENEGTLVTLMSPRSFY